jgi:tRNA nucleotidyltransferase (CCA-adding enzyme)
MQGGSLGKGTAVRGDCDLDLVLFLNGYSTVADFKRNLSTITESLTDVICQWQWDSSGFNVDIIENKGRVVCITMNYDEEGETRSLPVDIVPAFTLRGRC